MQMWKFFLVFSIGLSGADLLAQKSLIVAKGADFAPGLAKSWTKSGGKVSLVLDTSKEVSRGKKLTAEMVKTSVEEKLKASYSAAVTAVSANKVEISYKGDEKAFLSELAKLRIRPESDIKLAAAGTVSDTGIRAKIAARNPNDGEVKVKVLSGDTAKMEVLVVEVGKAGVSADIRANTKIWVSGIADRSSIGKLTILKVGEPANGVWAVTEAKQ